MESKFYQLCYATTVDAVKGNGWKVLNASPAVPGEVTKLFTDSEKSNETNIRKANKVTYPQDNQGQPLNMLEIISGLDYIGMAKVKYGYHDAVGRDSFFTHGFIFPDAYEILKHPEGFLAVGAENFKTGDETINIPETLIMDNTLSISQALRITGMNRDTYVKYMQCLHYILGNARTTYTLYVKTDGTDEMMKALLYLAYKALPYSMRKKITAAGCTELNQDSSKITNKILLFGRDIPEGNGNILYLDPQTGENNFIKDNFLKRLARNPYTTYFAEHYDDEIGNQRIFRSMEKWLGEMGNKEFDTQVNLDLAFSMHSMDEAKSVDEQELIKLLYGWLNLPVPNSEILEQNIAMFLMEAVNRKLVLSEQMEEMLAERAEEALTEDFSKTYLRYLSLVLPQKTKEESYEYLMQLGKTKVFLRLREQLLSSKEGRRLLNGYYPYMTQKIAERQDCTRDELIEAYYDCKEDNEEVLDKVQRIIHKKNEQMALEEFNSSKDFSATAMAYRELETEIMGESSKEEIIYLPVKLTESYDKLIKDTFEINKKKEYQDFYCSDGAELDDAEDMRKFFCAVVDFDNGDYNSVEEYLVSDSISTIDDDLIEKFAQYAFADKVAAEQKKGISLWIEFSDVLDTPFIDLFVKTKRKVFESEENFRDSLEEEEEFWTREQLEEFQSDLKTYLRENESEPSVSDAQYEMLQQILKITKEAIKQKKKEGKQQKKGLFRGLFRK